jgi:serine O-acetyltransferase
MNFHDFISADLARYKDEVQSKHFISALQIPGFRYTYILRKASFLKKKTISGLFFRFLLRFYSLKYGYQINPSTKIGKGLYIGHRGTIIVNSLSVIGACCNLSPGVTIGQTNRGVKKGAPILGDKVWVGTNAVVVGGIKIGDNVLIAPNAYVNVDVPSNSIVIGNPAQIIFRENATEGYIDNCSEII